MIEVRHLPAGDLRLLYAIDRSERIHLGYSVEGGELVSRPVDWEVPNWDPIGTGEHSVHHRLEAWGSILERGGLLLGAFADDELAGIAIVEPEFEPGLAWLAVLHVGRPHRHRRAASALWEEAERLAAAAGAGAIYVSATPSESAVGFYLSKGCALNPTPHPELFALEPEDIHLTRSL